MATFTEQEIQQIWFVTGLGDPYHLIQGSTLRSAIRELEEFDVMYNTSLVSQVKGILAEITELESALTTASSSSGISSISIEGQGSVSYQNNFSVGTTEQALIGSKVARIRQILRFNVYGLWPDTQGSVIGV